MRGGDGNRPRTVSLKVRKLTVRNFFCIRVHNFLASRIRKTGSDVRFRYHTQKPYEIYGSVYIKQ
jgi:hypothetical protein